MVEAEGMQAEEKESDRSLTDDLQRQKKPKETTRGYEAIARQEIRRARRLVTDGQPTPEATFAVSIAGVLALLDLASAIREQGSKGE
jgi:hypothetical protein